MLIEMIKCTLMAYRINEQIKPEEVYQMLNVEQLHILKDNIER